MTVVAIEVVEVQVRVEDEDPGVNTRGLRMVGQTAWRAHTVHAKYGHVGLMFNEKVSGPSSKSRGLTDWFSGLRPCIACYK